MSKLNILVVIGTRPELIKLVPIINILRYSNDFNVKVCLTGQHHELLDLVLYDFDVSVDFKLDVMSPNQSLASITSKILNGVSNILNSSSFKFIIVHGDTTTAMAASLAAFYSGIDVCYVESGLRTSNIFRPFPEEFNRRVISLFAKFNFAPTERAQENLLLEGVAKDKILVTGNTVIDSLFMILDKIKSNPEIDKKLSLELFQFLGFDFTKDKFILITAHRRENISGGLENICNAIFDLAVKYPQVYFVYPVHLNPNLREIVFNKLNSIKNIKLIEPLSYMHFVLLLKNCYFVLTDSGGIQEEAPSLGKPVLVMRSETERPEAISAGTVKLVSADASQITQLSAELLESDGLYKKMSRSINPYGDGKASIRIEKALKAIYLHE